MNPFIQKLEAALFHRNPSLAQSLQPGLSAAKIKKDLKRAGIEGAIEPVVELYSWRDGSRGGYADAYNLNLAGGFVPPRVVPLSPSQIEVMRAMGVKRDSSPERYHLMDFKNAVMHTKSFKSGARYNHELSILAARYFLFLWDPTSMGYIAVDLEPSAGNRVVKIIKKGGELVWEAYDSFEAFLNDAIHCNETNVPLACILNETRPIVHEPVVIPAPVSGAKDGKISIGEKTLALRTDFSDEAAWKSLCAAVAEHQDEELGPNLDFVSNLAYDGLTAKRLPAMVSEDSSASFALIVDREAMSNPDHPILVVDLSDKPGRTFRAVPAALADVESNLSTANMGFEEFAKAVDKEGVFRGFPEN